MTVRSTYKPLCRIRHNGFVRGRRGDHWPKSRHRRLAAYPARARGASRVSAFSPERQRHDLRGGSTRLFSGWKRKSKSRCRARPRIPAQLSLPALVSTIRTSVRPWMAVLVDGRTRPSMVCCESKLSATGGNHPARAAAWMSMRHPASKGSRATKPASLAPGSSLSSNPWVMPRCRVQTTGWFSRTASR
jgi:hypothetical protein